MFTVMWSRTVITTLRSGANFPGISYRSLFSTTHFPIPRRNFHRFSKKIDPKGKAVFITGCDTGTGYDLAIRLRNYGFYVYSGCLDPESPGGQRLHSCTKLEKGRLCVVPCDVTKWKEVQACSETVSKDIGERDLELWAVVNNAGVSILSEFEWVPMEQYEEMMDVNCMGSVRVVKAFLPLLRESRGRLIIIASLAGRYVVPGLTVYSMTKHAQVALADGLRRELRKFGITVSTIEPTAYRTAFADTKRLLSQLEGHWSALQPSVQHAYGWYYYEAMKVHLPRLAALTNPHVYEPVDETVKAVTSSRIKVRYVAAAKMALFRAILFPFLPTSLQDFFMQRMALDLPKKK